MNFVLFFPDEMSAPSVSCYGNSIVQMPNYDRLSAQGSRFENCIVQNPVCAPSRCSLMTGLYVHNMGHRSLWSLLRPHEPSLFRYLKNAGYDIPWFGKNEIYSYEYLNEICSDIEEKRNGYKSKPVRNYLSYKSVNPYRPQDPEYYSFLFPPIENNDKETPVLENVARGIDYLNNWGKGDKPFFLFLPINMPHPPYQAPKRFHEMYDPQIVKDQLESLDDTSGKPEYAKLIRKYRRLDELNPDFMAKIHATYLGMNSYVDYMLGEIMDVMEERGLFEDTVLIVASDHGDWSGHYGLVEKWPNAMDDLLVRVPLIIRAPQKKAGHVVKEQVELFDVMPTVMDLAKIEVGHTHFARSLIPQLEGGPGDPERFVFSEGGYDAQDERCFEYLPRDRGLHLESNVYYPKVIQQRDYPASVCRTAMIRSLTDKLVLRTSGENEFYDLKNDPHELVNIYNDPKKDGIKKDMEARLLQWYIHTSDVVPLDDDDSGFGKSK
jgi:arylsulfatase A-like enzyme